MTCQESDAVLDGLTRTLRGMEFLTRAERSAVINHFLGCAACSEKLEARIAERIEFIASHLSPADAAQSVAECISEGWASGTRIALADEAANDPEAR